MHLLSAAKNSYEPTIFLAGAKKSKERSSSWEFIKTLSPGMALYR
jgi:hypothetical protein